MLVELVRKDLRLCRLPIVAVFSAVLGSGILGWMLTRLALPPDEFSWSAAILAGAKLTLQTGMGTLVLVAGNVFAAERADGSAQFLACLPPSRAMIAVSKAIVLAGSMWFVWGIAFLGESISRAIPAVGELPAFLDPPPSQIVCSTVGMIGAAWAVSQRSRGPGVAVLAGVVASPIMTGSLFACFRIVGREVAGNFIQVHSICMAGAGVLLLLLGAADYIRRLDP